MLVASTADVAYLAPDDVEVVSRHRNVLLAWSVSRIVAVVGLVAGQWWRIGHLSLRGFVAWDGQWYHRIAVLGYGAPPTVGRQSPWPFFVLLPALLRALHAGPMPDIAVMVIANHLVFLVALVGVWELAEPRFGAEIATRSVWAVALFPMSGVFSMLYPSSIFLAASVWAFAFAERHRWVSCGTVACVATLARPNGAITAAVVAAVALSTVTRAERWKAAATAAVPAGVALAVWIGFCTYRTGNPFVFLTAKSAWHEVTITAFARHIVGGYRFDSATIHVGLAAIAVLVLWAAWDRLPRSWRVLAIATLAVPMVTGIVGLGRYSNECFPLAIAGGAVLTTTPRWARYTAAALSITAAGAAAATMAAHGLVP